MGEVLTIKGGTYMVIEDKQYRYIEEVAAYIRVSTTEQKTHGLSLDAQVQTLTEYAEKHHLKIVEWYKDEGVSARKLIRKRPELQRMINDAQKGKFKRIIFIKLDRFFRSVAEYHECMKLIEPVIWTATEEKYDLSTANGRAFVNMKLTIAELEADTAGERVQIVNEYKIKTGLPLFGDQSLPFCYTVSQPKEGERHKYIAKRDQEIMEDLVTHVMVNHSVRAAVIYINNKYGRSFRYNAVMSTLRNEMICGHYKGNPNYCPPYISKAMFDDLQKIVAHNPRTSYNEYPYIFTGLIRCPGCGTRMTGAMQVNSRGDKKYRYHTYRCNNNRTAKTCDFGKRPFENKMEQLMLDRLEDIIAKKKAESVALYSKGAKVSKHNLTELQTELDRLNYSWQKGRIKTVEEYDKRYDEIMAQIDEATAEQANRATEPDYEKLQSILTENWQGIYENLDNEHKRAFWRSFVDEIHIEWTDDKKDIINVEFF